MTRNYVPVPRRNLQGVPEPPCTKDSPLIDEQKQWLRDRNLFGIWEALVEGGDSEREAYRAIRKQWEGTTK